MPRLSADVWADVRADVRSTLDVGIVRKLIGSDFLTISDVNKFIDHHVKIIDEAEKEKNQSVDFAKRNFLPYIRDVFIDAAFAIRNGIQSHNRAILSIACRAKLHLLVSGEERPAVVSKGKRRPGRKPKFPPTEYYLRKRLRSQATRVVFKSIKRRAGNTEEFEALFGYPPKKLEAKLIKTLPEGYIWDDFLSGALHLDHVIPLSAFNFTSVNHLDFRRAWHYSNLQLLPARANLQKSDKLIHSFQPALAL